MRWERFMWSSQRFLSALSKGFEFSVSAQLSVSKPRRTGSYLLMVAQNPVFVFVMQEEEVSCASKAVEAELTALSLGAAEGV